MTNTELRTRKQLEFLGAVGASLSHELNNVFAIVAEHNGLLGDLLATEDDGDPAERERKRRTVERIAAHVARGTAYAHRLNYVAHCHEIRGRTLDAGQVLERVATECRRAAALRRIDLDVVLPAEPAHVWGDLLDLMHLFYRCLEEGIEATAEGETVALSLHPEDGETTLRVVGRRAPDGSRPDPAAAAFLDTLADSFGARIDRGSDAGESVGVALTLPRELRAGRELERGE